MVYARTVTARPMGRHFDRSIAFAHWLSEFSRNGVDGCLWFGGENNNVEGGALIPSSVISVSSGDVLVGLDGREGPFEVKGGEVEGEVVFFA